MSYIITLSFDLSSAESSDYENLTKNLEEIKLYPKIKKKTVLNLIF